MKKSFALILALLLVVVLTACKDKSVLHDESNSEQGVGNTDNAVGDKGLPIGSSSTTPVDVYHVKGGTVNEWTISDEQQLNDLWGWFSGLSLEQVQFAKGQSPGDKNGGEPIITKRILQKRGIRFIVYY
jgi:hypothetical protein